MNTTETNQLIAYIVEQGVLQFGNFTLKSGRKSPYFFNLGNICDARGSEILGKHYADAIADYQCDMLFGPAYKGISLACSTSILLLQHHQRNLQWCYNRKEVKDHGEGGLLVGAKLAGKVIIVDDVLTAGTAARESVSLIRQQGAEATALLVFLDRMELGSGSVRASDQLRKDGLDVISVLSLEQIIAWLEHQPQEFKKHLNAMRSHSQSLV